MLKNLTKHLPKKCITLSIVSLFFFANADARSNMRLSGYICRVLNIVFLIPTSCNISRQTSSPYSS